MAALLMGLAAALAWGLHDLLVRRIAQGADVMPMVAVEMAVAAVWMGLLAAVFGHWGTVPPAAFGSGVAYCFGLTGLYKAFSLAPVRLVAPILGAFPLISLALAVAQGRGVGVMDWVAAVAVVGGVCVVAMFGQQADGVPGQKARAALWAVVGAAGFAGTFALGQSAARGADTLMVMAAGRIAAMVVMAAVVLGGRFALAPLRPYRAILVAVGTLDTLALGLVIAAGQLPHAEYAAVSSSLFGVITILLAWRFLGEKVSPGQWLGIAVIFAAIAKLSAG